MCLSVCLSLYVFLYVSVCVYVSVFLPLCVSVHVCVHTHICVPMCMYKHVKGRRWHWLSSSIILHQKFLSVSSLHLKLFFSVELSDRELPGVTNLCPSQCWDHSVHLDSPRCRDSDPDAHVCIASPCILSQLPSLSGTFHLVELYNGSETERGCYVAIRRPLWSLDL